VAVFASNERGKDRSVQADSRFDKKLIFVGVGILLIVIGALPAGAGAAPMDQAVAPAPPSPSDGRESYLQNCAPCHGESGKGDGPSAQGLGVPPAVFADYDAIADLPLSDWFDVTKNGRMDRMMPPWGARLTDQQIWDTVAYAWTLHTSPAQAAMGKAVYEINCVSCHGADGKGKPPMPDFTDFSATAGVSQNQWAQAVAAGVNGMPAFGNQLSEAERTSALEYVRSLALGPMFSSTPLSGSGVISGTVINGTTGMAVPDLSVELAVSDGTSLLDQRVSQTDAAGVYRFEGLPTDPTLVFATRAEYPAGATNSSEVVSFQPGQDEIDLPLPVYETTSDASGVRADRVHYIMEFQDGQALVAELVLFSLDGDRAYVGDGTGVLRFVLPPGAQDLSISDGELGGRYLQTEDGFVDTLPLPPGQATRQVLYRYTLPYSQGKLDLTRSLPYPAVNVNALVADLGEKVTAEGLENQGIRPTQSGNYVNLMGQNLPANQPIVIHLSGLSAAGAAAATAGSSTSSRILLYALAAVAVSGAILMAAWPVLRRRAQAGAAASESAGLDQVIDALASLEVAYESGQLSEAAYRDRRLRLKAQLLDLRREEQGQ
jgi:mono/diheme cytochrome c family protein